MTEAQILDLHKELHSYRDALRTFHEALDGKDGREVKAFGAELAIAVFRLSEAAEKMSAQPFVA